MASGSQIWPLSFAVRPWVVGKYAGQLCVVVAALNLVPALVALSAADYRFAAAVIVPALLLGGAGALLSRVAEPRQVQRNEALVISALLFLVTPAAMAPAFFIAGFPPIDALFEAVSAVTTTGLSTSNGAESLSASALFARSWMQWYGGLGFMALSMAVLLTPSAVAHRLFSTEHDPDALVGNTRIHSQRILMVYVGLSAFCFVVLAALGEPLFNALVHTLSAVSTGGFSAYDNSLAGQPHAWLPPVTLLFSFAGAISFTLYYRLVFLRKPDLLREPEVWALLGTTLLGATALVIILTWADNMPLPRALYNGLALGASAQSTTGYATTDVGALSDAAKLLILGGMFVGGQAGSTAGGIKFLRLLILLRVVQMLVVRTSAPRHAVATPRLGGKPLEPGEVSDALCIVLLYALTVWLSWIPFLLFGHAPLDALFDVISATGTVGLSTGVTSAGLHPVLKGVLCVDMLLGRLEILAFLVILYPYTWFGKRRD